MININSWVKRYPYQLRYISILEIGGTNKAEKRECLPGTLVRERDVLETSDMFPVVQLDASVGDDLP